jgi:hypothetical protein
VWLSAPAVPKSQEIFPNEGVTNIKVYFNKVTYKANKNLLDIGDKFFYLIENIKIHSALKKASCFTIVKIFQSNFSDILD